MGAKEEKIKKLEKALAEAKESHKRAGHDPNNQGIMPRHNGLSEDKVKAFLQLRPEEIQMIDRIAAGRAPKNSHAILRAIKMKLDFSLPKPVSAAGAQVQAVNVIVKTFGQPEVMHPDVGMPEEDVVDISPMRPSPVDLQIALPLVNEPPPDPEKKPNND